LRVGPWLSHESAAGPPADDDMTGPSWTAPTVELRPAERRPSRAPAGGSHRAGDAERPVRPAVAWLREYAWLLAAGGVAVVVLLCARFLVGGAVPTWVAEEPVAARPVATTPPAPAATTTGAAAMLSSTRAPLPPTPRASTPRPTASPVLLGPGGDVGLWLMLRRYCDEAHGARDAQLRSGVSPAENNWECRGRGGPVPVDLTAACRHAYGAGAFARYGDADNALSWRCYR
jgi:hypothetical protein